MTQAIGQDVPNVLVGEAVVDDASGLAAAHHAPITQEAQLVRESRLAPSEQQREIADAQLVRQREGVQQSGAGRIGEQLEDRGQILGFRRGNDFAQEGSDMLWVEALDLAAVRRQFLICTIAQIL